MTQTLKPSTKYQARMKLELIADLLHEAQIDLLHGSDTELFAESVEKLSVHVAALLKLAKGK